MKKTPQKKDKKSSETKRGYQKQKQKQTRKPKNKRKDQNTKNHRKKRRETKPVNRYLLFDKHFTSNPADVYRDYPSILKSCPLNFSSAVLLSLF